MVGEVSGWFGFVDSSIDRLIDKMCDIRTVMLSPSGRILRLFPLKVVCLASSFEALDDAVGAPSTAEAAVQSARRVWAICIFLIDLDRLIDRNELFLLWGRFGMECAVHDRLRDSLG